jgi:hypothetical protein
MSAIQYVKLNLALTFLWMLVIPLWYLTSLRDSVAFVGAISIYANVAGHFSAYQAARTERKQDELMERHD